MKLKDRVVLISGATAGIGREVAVAAARRGARGVAIMARRPDALKEVAREIEAAGAQALCLAADVAHGDQVQRAVDEAVAHFGHVDVVIANAGTGTPISALAPDQQAIEEVMNINYFGSTRLIGAALPHMIARGQGHVVGISSLAGYRGMARGGAYCASKAALSTLLESYRVELAPHGIPVTTILPGFVNTELTARNQVKPIMAISVEEAGQTILDGIEAEVKVLRFPALTGWLMILLRVTPNLFFDRITRFMARERLREPPPQRALPPAKE